MEDTRIIVRFLPCGDVSYMTPDKFVELGKQHPLPPMLELGTPQQQLDDIEAGVKLDAATLSSEYCFECEEVREARDRLNASMLDEWPEDAIGDDDPDAAISREERAVEEVTKDLQCYIATGRLPGQ